MPPFAAHSTCSLLWLRFFDVKVSVFPFANVSCQIQTYLLLEVFIKVTNDLVAFHGEDNVILSVFQRCYVLDAQSLPDVFLTICSKKTILSLSACYFHLVILMFKVTVTVSVIRSVKLQISCVCIGYPFPISAI